MVSVFRGLTFWRLGPACCSHREAEDAARLANSASRLTAGRLGRLPIRRGREKKALA